jgi:SpoVK/Ycf46/Vps4 family AAA+-type ATPase
MDMLARYNCVTKDDYREALKEIIQEIALPGPPYFVNDVGGESIPV